MSISNSQFDEIMREYDIRQLHNQDLLAKRRREVYQKNPKLKEIEDSIAGCSVESARKLLSGDTAAMSSLRAQLADFRRKKEDLLRDNGYPADYLSPIYTCKDCQDTGYVNGQRCHCLKQAIINVVYSQSNIRPILERENFSTFSYDYYSNTQVNPTTGLTALETAQHAVRECLNFINHFSDKPKNLLFYGNTGVGKTFLSNCIAKELLDRGNSVIYFSASQLFDTLSKGTFAKDADAIAAHQNIYDCDLLIIDDLGTELPNTFTTSQLFLCINERILRQKSTIISTNLNPNQINEIYSERTLSRISSNYITLKLFGDDIRIKKRRTLADSF